MARMKLEIEGFDQILNKLKALDANAKKVAEKALTDCFKITTEKSKVGMAKPNLPAGGDYSTGKTLSTLLERPKVEWTGDTATVRVGFDISEGGFPSIFLMYGTPRMKKDQKLYNAFYGAQTKREITEAIENALYNEIRRLEN